MSEPGSPAPQSPPAADVPVVAQYLATFLKPEMLHIYRQITALRAFRPIVLCHKRENAEAFPFADLRILKRPLSRAVRRVWQKQILERPITISATEARRMAAVLEEIRAQVLHVYFGHMGVHVLPLLENCPVPAIVSFHGADAGVDLDRPAHLELTRQMLDHATLLLVRSESLARRLTTIGADARKIRLHRTGIPLADIPFHQHAAPADGAWRCVQTCRLIPKKGLVTTLRAFAEFAREFPKSRLTIAGTGPQLEELQALGATLGIAERIDFPGFLPQAELHALYAQAHLFLHPSETAPDGDQEGVPNSMLEAMASGLPVVATTHGGIPEAVEHGVSGWLVPEHDDGALAHGLLQLAQHPDRYTEMSAAAATRVSTMFEVHAQARVLEGYYREAIEIGGGTGATSNNQ